MRYAVPSRLLSLSLLDPARIIRDQIPPDCSRHPRSPSTIPGAFGKDVDVLSLQRRSFWVSVMVASFQPEPESSLARNFELTEVIFDPDVKGVAGAVRFWGDR